MTVPDIGCGAASLRSHRARPRRERRGRVVDIDAESIEVTKENAQRETTSTQRIDASTTDPWP